MGLILKASGGGSFDPHPEGPYQAVCVDIIDLGMVETEWKGKKRTQPKMRFAFETNCDVKRPSGDGSPWMVWSSRYTASLSERATVRAFLESWRGKAFTPPELGGFDTEDVYGANAVIQIVHHKVGDKAYANINSIMRPMKGAVWLEPARKADGSYWYMRVKDRPVEGEHGAPPTDDPPPPDDDSDIPF